MLNIVKTKVKDVISEKWF